MNEKERHLTGGNAGDPTGQPAGNLKAIRQEADAFLAAADKAIDNVLSGDSTKFNQAARQRGGQ